MKKLGKLKWLCSLAVVLLLLSGLTACSDGDDDNGSSNSVTGLPLTTGKVAVNTSAAAGTVTMNGAAYADLHAAFAAIGASGDYTIELTEGAYDVGRCTVADNGTNVKNDNAGLRYQGAANITIKGPAASNEYGAKVVIFGSGASMDNEGGNQPGRELLEIAGSGNAILENIALYNVFEKDGDCQAEALGFDSTGTFAAYNCTFISRQDTTRTTGKAWFYKCYVEGDVDFIWMESSGKVALYEDCRLRAVKGREKTDSKGEKKQVDAYFTAPRVNIVEEATYGKGVVIYNSAIEVEDGLTTYLFRNPWGNNSAYYNNVAIVNSKLYGTVQSSPMWKNDPMYDKLNACGGFKTNIDGLNNMNETVVSNEYAGRNNILNRVFDSETNSMHKDFAGAWDLSALETAFSAVADASQSLLPGENELVMKSIDFVAPAKAITSEAPVETNDYKVQQANIEQSKKDHGFWLAAQGNSKSSMNSYIVLKNVPKYCKVTFYACQYGEGAGTVTGPNNFTTDFECKKTTTCGDVGGAFVYNGGEAGDLTITFTSGNAWVHGVFIREYEALTPATGITMSAPKTSIFTDEAVQLSATIAPADVTLKAMKWTSSDPSIVYVSDKGLIMGMKVGKATITVATKDGTNKTDSMEITVTEKTAKPEEGKSYSWNMQGGVGCPYFSPDMLFQCKGDSDNGSHGLVMKKGSVAIVDVAGNVKVTLHRCRYDNPGICTVTDKAGNTVAVVNFPEGEGGGVADTGTLEYAYIGPATTLTMTWSQETGANYLHQVDVDPLKDSDIVKATAIEVSAAGGANKVAKGGTLQLSATITPDTASSKTVKWASSDESKATVSANGLVTGVAVTSSVTITATAVDGSGVSGSYAIEVFQPAPTEGVTYTYNLTGGVGFPYVSEDTFLNVSGAGNDNKDHGLNLGNDSIVKLSVAGTCRVTIQTCRYDKASSVVVTKSDTSAVTTVTIPAGAGSGDDPTTQTFVYNGAADTLNLAWSGNSYVHGIIVEPLIGSNKFFDLRKLNEAGCTAGGATQTKDVGLIHIEKMYWKDAQHGAWFYKVGAISFKVVGPCTVYLARNPYNKTTYAITSTAGESSLSATTVNATVEESDGTIGADETDLSLNAKNPNFQYTGTGPATITIALTDTTKEAYLPAIQVKF